MATVATFITKLGRFAQNKDKLYSLLDTALTSLFRLGSSILLAKIAGAEVFAQYVLITSGIVIVQSLAQNYFTTPIVHSAGFRKAQVNWLYQWSNSRLRGLQLILLLILIVFFAYAFIWEKKWIVLIGFALSSVVLLSIQHIKAYRQTRFENLRMLIGNLCGISLHIGIFVIGIQWNHEPLVVYGWGLLASHLLTWLMCRPWRIASGGDEAEIEPAMLASVRRNGWFMMLGSLTGIFSSRLQPFALATFTSALAVAQFGAVMTIAGPIRMSSMFLQNVLRPRFALYHNQNDHSSFRSLKRNSILFLVVMGSIGVLVSFFVEAWLLEVCFSLNSSVPSGILTLAFVYTTLDAITSCQMLSMQVGIPNGVAITTRLRFISAVVGMVLIVPLCFYGGSIGALGSLIASEIVYGILATYIDRKNT